MPEGRARGVPKRRKRKVRSAAHIAIFYGNEAALQHLQRSVHHWASLRCGCVYESVLSQYQPQLERRNQSQVARCLDREALAQVYCVTLPCQVFQWRAAVSHDAVEYWNANCRVHRTWGRISTTAEQWNISVGRQCVHDKYHPDRSLYIGKAFSWT